MAPLPPAVALDARRAALLALVASTVALAAVSGVPQHSPGPDAPGGTDPVALDDGGPYVWPYVARTPGFDRATSPLNVAFDAPPERVRAWFVARDWNTPGAPAAAFGEGGWRETRSADRYVYVAAAEGGPGEWHAPAYQLYRGAYFGDQHHLRVFDASAGGRAWTVVQAHSEHWDWFAITHRVDSVEQPRRAIERRAIVQAEATTARPDTVRRRYFGTGGSFDNDGWMTVIRLSVLAAVGAAVGGVTVDRRTRRQVALALGIAGVLLAVRIAGTLAEAAGVGRGVIVAVLYPAMVAGLPLVALRGGRRLDRASAFGLAAGAAAVAILLDYALVTVASLSIAIVVHRGLVAVALGLLAAGAPAVGRFRGQPVDPRAATALAAGAVLWVVAVLAPHTVL